MMTATVLRGTLPIEALSGYGYGNGNGDGYGYGNGDGNGYGYGNGDGNGDGYGNGNGDGYGNGNGDGYGYGNGDGNGYGYGNGDGNGDGYGNGDGNGDGYGYGYGDGNGDGYGYGDGENSIPYWSATIETVISTWDVDRKKRAAELQKQGAILAYWRSTKNGTPANGGKGTVAVVGLVEEIKGPLKICTAKGLHGTLNPPKWSGERIWIVALHPPFQTDDDKIASLKREFLGEVNFKLD